MKNLTNRQIVRELQKYEPKSMKSFLPIAWSKAKDYTVTDVEGNIFIDFTSTIFVANSGHSNTNICNSLRKQINKELIHSYSFPNEIRFEYLKKLTTFTGFDKAFLLSAGTEATEAACKIMRTFTKKYTILSFEGSMHGKTNFSASLKEDLNFMDFHNIIRLKHPSGSWKDTLLELKDYPIKNIGGIIIESYRGWDADFFSTFYMRELVEWAKKNKILVCFDEIQAGFGRTGKMFAYEWYKVRPDLVCCGKGLGGGLPISAVLGRKELLDCCDDLSSTNSANPLVCAGALANVNYIEKHKLIKRSLELGLILDKRLREISEKYDIITGYNSRGLIGAILLANCVLADCIVERCMKKGLLLVHTGRESIKIGPPLVISKEALLEGLNIIEESFKEFYNER